jgi:transcriptional regulator with XRE-family HTH domain
VDASWAILGGVPARKAGPFGAQVGARLRQLREDLGLRQEEIAVAARKVGLGWDRSIVASIETGQRELRAEELLLLPLLWTLSFRGEDGSPLEVGLVDLLPGGEWVQLTNDARVRRDVLVAITTGRSVVALGPFGFDVPAARELFQFDEELPDFPAAASMVKKIAPDLERASNSDRVGIWEAERGDAEQKAARKLGVSAFTVAIAAWQLWRRSLSDERDARVSEHAAPDAPARTMQALRAHATRRLLAELEPLVKGAKGGARRTSR